MVHRAVCFGFLWVALTLAGCADAPSTPTTPKPAEPAFAWQIVDSSDLSESQAAQRERALSAQSALMDALKGRLMEVVSKDGLAAAITVCKEDAPRLAAETAEEYDLQIGRTSYRLRNSKNRPPDWAQSLVAEKTSEPTYLTGDGRLAALLPITTGPLCLNCHGTKEGISDDVLETLGQEYPNDRATGFEEGGLRGWFWIEVPADASESLAQGERAD